MDAIEVEERTFAEDADPLRDEIAAFVAAVRVAVAGGQPSGGEAGASQAPGAGVAVSGREALVALEIGERVRTAVASEASREGPYGTGSAPGKDP